MPLSKSEQIVGNRKTVAVTQGFAAMLTDLEGNVLLSFSMFEDGLTLRTRVSGVFNAQMFAIPEKYRAKQKQNGELLLMRQI